jgi:GTPase SAR1 family protein
MTNIQEGTPREIYNILLLGEPRSGKTRFFNQLYDIDNTQKREHEYKYLITTNIDLCAFNYNIQGHKLRIQLWDTPSSSAYHQIISRFLIKPFYMIIIMFTANMISKISNWLDFIKDQNLSYTPIIMLMENDSEISQTTHAHSQQLDIIIEKYPYLKYSMNIHGQSSYILKTIIEESMITKTAIIDTSSLCCKDRKYNRCCF